MIPALPASEPTAKRVPHELRAPHGHVRSDPYYWLRERDDPEVIAYLEAENRYVGEAMADTAGLQATLFEEIKGRIKQDDRSVPYRDRSHLYYTRYRKGESYPLYCRRPAAGGAEQVMLDVPAMAEGHEFYDLDEGEVSPREDILAYSVDTVGRRFYEIRFRDLGSGADLPDRIPNTSGGHAWANDNRTLYYSVQHPQTLRDYRIYRHVLGTPVADDELVYEEQDEEFHCYVYKTKSDRFVVIGSSQTLSDEVRLIDADRPGSPPVVFAPRRRGHEYDIEHFGDVFYIRTNRDAENFRLMECPLGKTAEEHWSEVIPARPDTYLSGVEVFRDFLVVTERHDALTRIRIRDRGGDWHSLDFGEPTYSAWLEENLQFDTELLRFGFSSLRTPESTFDYNMRTRERTLLKQTPVLGGFDRDDYASERLFATAPDGSRVPVSIVYRKGLERDGTAPLLLYAYGAYGYSTSASFSSSRLSLLDRGFAYAIAHVRGGQEFGRRWYDDGRLMRKANTFTDFIACAEHLVAEGFTSRDRLFANGGSAGGLLVGAVANMRPDLFHGIVADVPFVDVVTTMLDDSIPLTTSEYDEWGDPAEADAYHYMLSYSPYDNVAARDYPHLLVVAGLHDSQVQFWEPAKWVAKLRHHRTDRSKLLLLKTDMSAGHGGPTGRFQRYRELAFEYAFLLKLAGRSG